MKITNQIFDELNARLVEFLGVISEKVTMEASLIDDLGVYGDDGSELFEMLDEHYNIEWDGLEIGVLFGNEGLGPPPPWALKNNCIMYKPQPCLVSDVVKAIELGKWEPTLLVPISSRERAKTYLVSYLYFGFLIALGAFGLFIVLI